MVLQVLLRVCAGAARGANAETHMQLDGEPWPQAIPAGDAEPLTVRIVFLQAPWASLPEAAHGQPVLFRLCLGGCALLQQHAWMVWKICRSICMLLLDCAAHVTGRCQMCTSAPGRCQSSFFRLCPW